MKELQKANLPSSEAIDEVAIVDEIVGGSQSALRRLYMFYGGLVYSIAYKIVDDTQEAEEVSQDVFVKIWRLADTFDPKKCSLKGWISLIARSSSLDRLRKRNRRPDRVLKKMVNVGIAEIQTLNTNEKSERNREAESVLFEGLATLREEYRQCLELAYFKGYTQKEIGRTLKIPEGTAKTYLRRGLMKLRELFEAK
ncbi:sigma-70 family RNA polymerase sigma factor [Puniceicoccaceae bacterium K14]|nr:sigma-70 family RNA polymerase sigma factor [Puniceicoccaceae bacterium K14]